MLMEHQLRVFDEHGRPIRIIDASESKSLAKDEYLEGISCFVVSPKGKLLLERRADGCDAGGLFDLCSGHTEWPENANQTVTRELREELGIKLTDSNADLTCIGRYRLFFGKRAEKNWFLTFFVVRLSEEQEIKLQQSEVDNFIWCEFDEFGKLLREDKTQFSDRKMEQIVLLAKSIIS